MEDLEAENATAEAGVVDESSSMIAVDEEGRILATGADAERLIAEHQALEDQREQEEQENQEQQEAEHDNETLPQEDHQMEDADQPLGEGEPMMHSETEEPQAEAQPMDDSTNCQESMEDANEADNSESQVSNTTQSTDILQQAFEASGAVSTENEPVAAEEADLAAGDLVEQAVARLHGVESTAEESTAEDKGEAVKDDQQENTPPPLGSCDNPIQIIQQGNTYHSTQTLSPDQLQQIAHVLQQQQVAKAIQNGGSAVVYNPQTNTRIIYRVICPPGKEKKDANKSSTPSKAPPKQPKIVKNHPKGYKGRGRPAKRYEDDVNPDGPSLSKEERSILKRQAPRTRSGRVSRPPPYMVKDYKGIHHLDFHEEPPPDNSDGGYSDIDVEVGGDGVSRKRKKLVLGTDLSLTGKPKTYRCSVCDCAYISSLRLVKHFQMTQHGDPNNLPPPVNVDEILASEEDSEEAHKVKKEAEKEEDKKRAAPKRSYAEMISSRKKNRLREAMRQCNDREVLEVCLQRVARASSLWQCLLAMSEDGGEPGVPDVSILLVQLETLLQQTEKLGKDFIVPTDDKDGDDVIELIDEMVCAALGNRKTGFYKVLKEAYNPDNELLVLQNSVRPKDYSRKHAIKAQTLFRNTRETGRPIVTQVTVPPRSTTSNIIVSNRPTPVSLSRPGGMQSVMLPPSIVRRTGNVKSYIPQASSVTMTPHKFSPNILSAPKMQFKVVTAASTRTTGVRSGTSLLRSTHSSRGGTVTRVTPQSIRGTSLLTTPQSITPAQHIQQQQHQQQQLLQQQQQQQQQQQLLLQQQQQAAQIHAGSSEEQQEESGEVSLVVGEVYEDENGQPVVINEDGTITPVIVQHVEEQQEMKTDTEDETLQQEGAALEQAIMQDEGTTATVAAVVGEGNTTVALALSQDSEGNVIKQIVLADGQVLGTCTTNGDLSLSPGVQLLSGDDGSNFLQSAQGNIQVALDTVKALFNADHQNVEQEN